MIFSKTGAEPEVSYILSLPSQEAVTYIPVSLIDLVHEFNTDQVFPRWIPTRGPNWL